MNCGTIKTKKTNNKAENLRKIHRTENIFVHTLKTK